MAFPKEVSWKETRTLQWSWRIRKALFSLWAKLPHHKKKKKRFLFFQQCTHVVLISFFNICSRDVPLFRKEVQEQDEEWVDMNKLEKSQDTLVSFIMPTLFSILSHYHYDPPIAQLRPPPFYNSHILNRTILTQKNTSFIRILWNFFFWLETSKNNSFNDFSFLRYSYFFQCACLK